MTTSTPRAIFCTWLERDTPPSTSTVDRRMPPASLRRTSSICTASSRVGARISARVVIGAARPELGESGQNRKTEGGRLARAGLGDAHDVAAPELRADGLLLDGSGSCEPRRIERADKLRREAEVGKRLGQNRSHVWPRASQSAREAAHLLRRAFIEAMATGICRGCDFTRTDHTPHLRRRSGPLRRSPHWPIRREVHHHSGCDSSKRG